MASGTGLPNRPKGWSGITAYGVVGTKVFAVTQGEILSDEKRYLLTFAVAVAVAVLALGFVEWASPEHSGPMSRKHQFAIRIPGALLLIILGVLGGQLSVGVLTTLVVLILLVQVGYDIYSRLREAAPEAGEISFEGSK
jgi:hypothetical protein